MQELIRPALFLVARLGLFFNVAFWTLTQWWTYKLSVGPLSLTCDSKGLLLIRWPMPVPWNLVQHCVTPTEPRPDLSDFAFPHGIFYHWQIFVFFAMLYSVLRCLVATKPPLIDCKKPDPTSPNQTVYS